jgi:deoxyribonuclease IV
MRRNRFIKMWKIGLKLWSTDVELVGGAEKLYKSGYFDYIELYIVPGTYSSEMSQWAYFSGKYTIHCSHSKHGFNLAIQD